MYGLIESWSAKGPASDMLRSVMTEAGFHHVELYRLREGVTLDRVRAAREAMAALVETLPGVLYFEVTDNLSDLNEGYTLALFSAFENRRAYEIFTRHPEFGRVWDELLAPVIADRLVAQGESE